MNQETLTENCVEILTELKKTLDLKLVLKFINCKRQYLSYKVRNTYGMRFTETDLSKLQTIQKITNSFLLELDNALKTDPKLETEVENE